VNPTRMSGFVAVTFSPRTSPVGRLSPNVDWTGVERRVATRSRPPRMSATGVPAGMPKVYDSPPAPTKPSPSLLTIYVVAYS